MAMRCMNCGKGVMYGHNVSHAKNRTPRQFRPNLHAVRVKVGTNFKKMKLCTKCLRMIKKATHSSLRSSGQAQQESNQKDVNVSSVA